MLRSGLKKQNWPKFGPRATIPTSEPPTPTCSAVDSSACSNQYDERLHFSAELRCSGLKQLELPSRASEVSADVRDNSKDCTRDDLRESMTRLVLGMHRMTTLHGTVTASGALEAFVSLFAATSTNVSVSGGAPTHGRRSYSSACRGLRTPSASIHTKSQRMPKKSGSNRSSTDHARR